MPEQPPPIKQAIAQKKFSCPACGGESHRIGPILTNPNGIGIIQPSVAVQRLRWVVVQTIYQL